MRPVVWCNGVYQMLVEIMHLTRLDNVTIALKSAALVCPSLPLSAGTMRGTYVNTRAKCVNAYHKKAI